MTNPEQKDVQRARDDAEREREGRQQTAQDPTREKDPRDDQQPEPFSGSDR